MLPVASSYRNRDKLRPDGPLFSLQDFTFTLLRKEETLMTNLSRSAYNLTVEKPFQENNTEFQFLRAAAFPLSLRSGFSDLLHNSRARISNRDGGVSQFKTFMKNEHFLFN